MHKGFYVKKPKYVYISFFFPRISRSTIRKFANVADRRQRNMENNSLIQLVVNLIN